MRAAISDKRQRRAGERQQAGHSADINESLYAYPRTDAYGDKLAEIVGYFPCQKKCGCRENDKSGDKEKASDKSGLFRVNGKNGIRG